MDRRLEESFQAYYPKDLYDRRTFAWRTIGVIPTDADLHEAYRSFLTGEVVGFYDPGDRRARVPRAPATSGSANG